MGGNDGPRGRSAPGEARPRESGDHAQGGGEAEGEGKSDRREHRSLPGMKKPAGAEAERAQFRASFMRSRLPYVLQHFNPEPRPGGTDGGMSTSRIKRPSPTAPPPLSGAAWREARRNGGHLRL